MLAALMLMSLVCVGASAESLGTKIEFSHSGDSNGDGIINMKDVLVLRQQMAGRKVTYYSGTDVNADGQINTKDLLLLRKYIAGWAVGDQMTDKTDNLNFVLGWQKGVNMGNALEGETEYSDNNPIKDEYFEKIADAGFDFVRVPIRWSSHMNNSAIIDNSFFERVDHVVNKALECGLGVIINVHHFNAVCNDPNNNIGKLYRIWEQLSEHYADMPQNVVFEPLNEPNGELTSNIDTWNAVQNKCIDIIRKKNPTRKIIVTGIWGGHTALTPLTLPKNDRNLIATVHYYAPFEFTHQGASWVDGMDKYLGTKWNGTESEVRIIDNHFKQIKAWSEAMSIPVLVGEFGAYEKADMESRIRWTECVRETCEKYGFAWSYWEFNAGYGIYDRSKGEFRQGLLKALIPDIPNTELGVANSNIKTEVKITDTLIGPVTYVKTINYEIPSWCAYYADDNGQTVTFTADNPKEWARVNLPLDLTDSGGKFNKNKLTLKLRSIDNSIEHLLINIEDGGANKEMQVAQLFAEDFKSSADKNGVVTVEYSLDNAYNLLKDYIGSGVRLKLFIESDPRMSEIYDGVGELELISISLE